MNAKLSYSLKRIAILLFILVVYHITVAQSRPPQNIRRVTTTSQYVFENGQKTDKFWAIYQEIYDSLGRLHTEIEYDFKDHYPHNYIWHTFNGMQRVKTEIYKNEKLRWIKEYSYSYDSLLTKEIVNSVILGDTFPYLTITYKYNLLKKPIQIEARKPNGKLAYRSKSTYDLFGTELTRKVKIRENYIPQDSITLKISEPIYDSVSCLRSEKLKIKKINKLDVKKTINYKYDKNKFLVGLNEIDEKGKQITREEFILKPKRNKISLIKYYDNNDILYNMISKRYEIYYTNDRRVRQFEF